MIDQMFYPCNLNTPHPAPARETKTIFCKSTVLILGQISGYGGQLWTNITKQMILKNSGG